MTTVCCVWVKGHVRYPVEYVTRLRDMVARHLRRPYLFACLTDRPEQLPGGVVAIRVPSPAPLLGWWSKVRLFDPALPLNSGRVLYLDLDTLVVDDLAPILDVDASFALVPHAGKFEPRYRAVVKRFNSSVMVWDGGTLGELFETWTPAVADRLHGDQDWIGEQRPHAMAMPLAWFPRLSEVPGPPFGQAKVILAKSPKNVEAARKWPWFRDLWHGTPTPALAGRL